MVAQLTAGSCQVASWRWLLVAMLCLIPMVFHGCHLGGHDEDLLRVYQPLFVSRPPIEASP